MENRVVRLARGEYKFEGDRYNPAHTSNAGDVYSAPVWREGFGLLQIVAAASRSSGRMASCLRAKILAWPS